MKEKRQKKREREKKKKTSGTDAIAKGWEIKDFVELLSQVFSN